MHADIGREKRVSSMMVDMAGMRGQDGGGNGGTTTIVGRLCVSSSLHGVSSLILLQLLRGCFSLAMHACGGILLMC